MRAPYSRRQRHLAVAMCASMFFLAATLLIFSPAPVTASKTWNVTMYGDEMSSDYYFDPATVYVNVGDSVSWTSVGLPQETVAASNQSEWWNSGIVPVGQSYTFTFTVPGTYNYSCSIDPIPMYGTVVVQQPTPEFPGIAALVVVAIGTFFAIMVERKLRS